MLRSRLARGTAAQPSESTALSSFVTATTGMMHYAYAAWSAAIGRAGWAAGELENKEETNNRESGLLLLFSLLKF